MPGMLPRLPGLTGEGSLRGSPQRFEMVKRAGREAGPLRTAQRAVLSLAKQLRLRAADTGRH